MSISDQKFTSETGIQDVINEIEKTKIVEYKINLIQPFFGSGKNEDNNDDNQKQNEIQTCQINDDEEFFDNINNQKQNEIQTYQINNDDGKNDNINNQKQNEIQTYQIKNLYSIYDEIYKIINKDKN